MPAASSGEAMRHLLGVVQRGVGAVRWAVVAGIADALLLVAMLLLVVVFVPQLAIDAHGLSKTDWLKAVQDLRITWRKRWAPVSKKGVS